MSKLILYLALIFSTTASTGGCVEIGPENAIDKVDLSLDLNPTGNSDGPDTSDDSAVTYTSTFNTANLSLPFCSSRRIQRVISRQAKTDLIRAPPTSIL